MNTDFTIDSMPLRGAFRHHNALLPQNWGSGGDFTIDTARQRYLDMLHRFLQGRIPITDLCMRWREEREVIWRHVWIATAAQQCSEREQLLSGEVLPAAATDP